MTNNEKHFLVSLYEWSAQVTEREIDRKCETLLRLKNSAATAYAEFIAASGSKAEAKSTGLALVKRFHLHAVRLKGEKFTIEDQQRIDDFINFARFKRFAAKTPSAALRVPKQISKAALTEALISRLEPVLGKAELFECAVWRYEAVAGPFRVATYVDLGGRLPLQYSHKIIAGNGQPFCETSLLQWHGIARETAWDSMSAKEMDSSVELLEELCTRFLAGFKNINASLG